MVLWRWLRPYLSILVRFMHISYLEAKADYYGTRLGLFWLPLSTLIFTTLLALVFRHSDTMPIADFYLYVLAGYILWQFIQDSITGSTGVIQKKLEFAVHNNLTLAGLFGKLLMDRLFEFSVNLVLLVVAVLLLGASRVGWELLAFLPFLGLMMVTSVAVAYLVNLITMFFPDLATLIRTGTRFVFFASPVFWSPVEGAGIRQVLAAYNPVSYYLAMIRQCFGIEPFTVSTWLVAGGISAVVCIAAGLAYTQTESLVRNIK